MDIASIRKGLERPGKTQRGLAIAMGIDATAVSRLLSGQRQLKASEVPKIEAYFDTDNSTQNESENASTRSSREISSRSGVQPEGVASPRLPVLGMAECGPDGWSLWNGDVIDTVPMPPYLAGVKQAYAVFVAGDSMAPRYDAGMVAHIHPWKPIMPGAYVLLQKKPKGPGEAPMAVIKRLDRRSASKIVLSQLNPPKTFEIRPEEVVSIHRVVGSAEA